MSRLAVLGLLAAQFLAGCSSCTPSPISPDSSHDASMDAVDATAPDASDAADGAVTDPCERACRNLAALHCPEAEPTEDGATCVDVCRNMEDSGVLSFNPECVAKATQCIAVDDCVHELR